jgi:hypothetical protein
MPMFKNTKVGSCSRVIQNKGVRKAIPFYVKASKNCNLDGGYADMHTLSTSSYRWREMTSALDSHKPLVRVVFYQHEVFSEQ